ncbi:hypothetical protein DEA98_28930 (plasmid) [Brucella pseudogrignonensis]|nr:hypothetical protein [Brucella pseudogrignonensis]
MPKTGRSLIGIVAGFKSEWWPVFDRNAGRLHVGIRISTPCRFHDRRAKNATNERLIEIEPHG